MAVWVPCNKHKTSRSFPMKGRGDSFLKALLILWQNPSVSNTPLLHLPLSALSWMAYSLILFLQSATPGEPLVFRKTWLLSLLLAAGSLIFCILITLTSPSCGKVLWFWIPSQSPDGNSPPCTSEVEPVNFFWEAAVSIVSALESSFPSISRDFFPPLSLKWSTRHSFRCRYRILQAWHSTNHKGS